MNQNTSHLVPPSIAAASYSVGDIDCSPARIRVIWMPDCQDNSKMLFATPTIVPTKLSLNPMPMSIS